MLVKASTLDLVNSRLKPGQIIPKTLICTLAAVWHGAVPKENSAKTGRPVSVVCDWVKHWRCAIAEYSLWQ